MKFVSLNSLALMMLISIASTSCKNRNYPPPPANNPEAEAARYGEGAANSEYPDGEYGGGPNGPASGDNPNNRFGFSGEDNSGPSRREIREMEKKEEIAEAPAPKKEEPEKIEKPAPPKKTGPPSVSEMKFANRVPGDALSVTLSGSGSSLGQISVEKYDSSGQPTGEPLPRGTPVEIPDPNNPGGKIYFKVP